MVVIQSLIHSFSPSSLIHYFTLIVLVSLVLGFKYTIDGLDILTDIIIVYVTQTVNTCYKYFIHAESLLFSSLIFFFLSKQHANMWTCNIILRYSTSCTICSLPELKGITRLYFCAPCSIRGICLKRNLRKYAKYKILHAHE